MIQFQSIGSRSSCKNIELVNILTRCTESLCICIFNKHDIVVNKLLKETISIVHQFCCRLTFAVTSLSSLLAYCIHAYACCYIAFNSQNIPRILFYKFTDFNLIFYTDTMQALKLTGIKSHCNA